MMLFFTFIHNQGNRAVVLISVHGLVIDRVVSKVFAYLHAKSRPPKVDVHSGSSMTARFRW